MQAVGFAHAVQVVDLSSNVFLLFARFSFICCFVSFIA
jgi:hypothetical protein